MGRGTITQIPAGKIGAGQQRARWSNGVDEANGQEKFGGNPDTAFIGGRDPVSGDRDGVRGKYATSQRVFGCQRAVYQRGERAGGGAADLLWPRGRVLWRGALHLSTYEVGPVLLEPCVCGICAALGWGCRGGCGRCGGRGGDWRRDGTRDIWRSGGRGGIDETRDQKTASGMAGDCGEPGVDVSYTGGRSLLG